MTFQSVIQAITVSLGISLLEDLILLFTFMTCIVLFARDFKIGLLSLFLLYGIEYIMFGLLGMQTGHVLIMLILSLISLAFSLFLTKGIGQVN